MKITLKEHVIRIQIVSLEGRLEAFTVASIRTEFDSLLESGSTNFVVDLSQVSFMDSAGMSLLVSLLKRTRQKGGDVVLVKPREAAAFRILTLTRFDKVFTLVNSIEEAYKIF
jgi:anti-sigma B factor antagonist